MTKSEIKQLNYSSKDVYECSRTVNYLARDWISQASNVRSCLDQLKVPASICSRLEGLCDLFQAKIAQSYLIMLEIVIVMDCQMIAENGHSMESEELRDAKNRLTALESVAYAMLQAHPDHPAASIVAGALVELEKSKKPLVILAK